MIKIISKILTSVLTALYTQFWFSIVLAVLLMQVYLLSKESSLKSIIYKWKDSFLKKRKFRYLFYFFFYLAMILIRTLLNRNLWLNPLNNVMGNWWIYNNNGSLNTECFENLILFVPFSFLMWLNFCQELCDKFDFKIVVYISFKVGFLFSLIIEFLQLFLHIGTFQLSDLFYNTLGGIVGGIIYWCYEKNKKKRGTKN